MAPFNMDIPTLAIPGDRNQSQAIELLQQAEIPSTTPTVPTSLYGPLTT